MAKKQQYHLHLRGYVGGYDFDAGYVDYVLGSHPDEEVRVLVDSLGGSVATALSISAAFARHGNVSVHFCGMNASAATIASLGARSITMDASAMYLVHKCSIDVAMWQSMNADALRQFIAECRRQKNDLEKIDDNVAAMYASKCKKPKDELLKLMGKGGWMTAAEALQWGFVDEITQYPEDGAKSIDDYAALAAIAASAYGSAIQDHTHKTTSDMEDKFKLICAAVGVAALESQDGYVSLSLGQMQAIENCIAEANTRLTDTAASLAASEAKAGDLATRLEAAEQQVEALQKQPAAGTQAVVADPQPVPSPLDDYAASVAAAKEMFNSLP